MSEITGVITFIKDSKTAKVQVTRNIAHKLYKKRINTISNFNCDTNSIQNLKIGDSVVIKSCPPISKTKSFKITKIISENKKIAK